MYDFFFFPKVDCREAVCFRLTRRDSQIPAWFPFTPEPNLLYVSVCGLLTAERFCSAVPESVLSGSSRGCVVSWRGVQIVFGIGLFGPLMFLTTMVAEWYRQLKCCQVAAGVGLPGEKTASYVTLPAARSPARFSLFDVADLLAVLRAAGSRNRSTPTCHRLGFATMAVMVVVDDVVVVVVVVMMTMVYTNPRKRPPVSPSPPSSPRWYVLTGHV